MSRPPVFVVGAPRSGTSLVYRVLCLHPDVAYVNNWHRRAPALAPLAALNRLPRRQVERRRATWFRDDGNAYVYGQHRSLGERAYPLPVEGEPVFAWCGFPEDGHVPPATFDRAAKRLQRTVRTTTLAAGAPVFVSKRIGHNRRIGALARALPDARFVHVVRDGRAVAASLANVDWWPEADLWWLGGGTPVEWEARGEDPWSLRADHWAHELDAARRGLAGLDADRVLEIGYEALVAHPGEVTSQLLRFAGLDVGDPRFRVGFDALRFPREVDRWRSSLDDAALATVAGVQHDALVREGYA